MHKTIAVSIPEEILNLLPDLLKCYPKQKTNSSLIRKLIEEALVYHLDYKPKGDDAQDLKVDLKVQETTPKGLPDEPPKGDESPAILPPKGVAFEYIRTVKDPEHHPRICRCGTVVTWIADSGYCPKCDAQASTLR